MQAIRSTRPGGHLGYVGRLPRRGTSRRGFVLLGHQPARRPRPGPPVPARVHRPDLEPADRSRQGVRPGAPAGPGSGRLRGDGHPAGHQGPPPLLTQPQGTVPTSKHEPAAGEPEIHRHGPSIESSTCGEAPPIGLQFATAASEQWRAPRHGAGTRPCLAAASTSSGVRSTTVRTLAPPASLTASANAGTLVVRKAAMAGHGAEGEERSSRPQHRSGHGCSPLLPGRDLMPSTVHTLRTNPCQALLSAVHGAARSRCDRADVTWQRLVDNCTLSCKASPPSECMRTTTIISPNVSRRIRCPHWLAQWVCGGQLSRRLRSRTDQPVESGGHVGRESASSDRTPATG